jgi:hypothetical protein
VSAQPEPQPQIVLTDEQCERIAALLRLARPKVDEGGGER